MSLGHGEAYGQLDTLPNQNLGQSSGKEDEALGVRRTAPPKLGDLGRDLCPLPLLWASELFPLGICVLPRLFWDSST